MQGDVNLHWFSIEVFDGTYPVSQWKEIFGEALLQQAFLEGMQEWDVKYHTHGVVLELGFRTRDGWHNFCTSLAAQRAFESVPDPISGFIIHEGRGGPHWNPARKPKKPTSGAGAAALSLKDSLRSDVFDIYSSAVEQRMLRNVMSNN